MADLTEVRPSDADRWRAPIEYFLTAKAAEGASPKTIEWYRTELRRAGQDLGAARALDSLTRSEPRAWLLTLRATLSPISVSAGGARRRRSPTWPRLSRHVRGLPRRAWAERRGRRWDVR